MSSGIDRQVPARLTLRYEEKFDGRAASARALHANAPILVAIPCQDQSAQGEAYRKAVTFDDLNASSRAELVPEFQEPSWQAGQSHLSISGGGASAGRPSSGSFAPRARMGFGAAENSFSAAYSSSHAATLKVVRAYFSFFSKRKG